MGIFLDIASLGCTTRWFFNILFIGDNSYAFAVDLRSAKYETVITRIGVSSTFTATNSSTRLGSNITGDLGETQWVMERAP